MIAGRPISVALEIANGQNTLHAGVAGSVRGGGRSWGLLVIGLGGEDGAALARRLLIMSSPTDAPSVTV